MADGTGQDIEVLARRAVEGDQETLERLILCVKDEIYGLSIRMLGNAADAEDACQEILIKMVTHIATFRGDSAFRTWVWRVACNHLLAARRSRAMRGTLVRALAADQPSAEVEGSFECPEPERALLAAQVRSCCTHGMAASLEPDHRSVLLLAEVFGLKSEQGATLLGITPAAFRKRLSRAKDRLRGYMTDRCGLFHPERPCRECMSSTERPAEAPALAVSPRLHRLDESRATYRASAELTSLLDQLATVAFQVPARAATSAPSSILDRVRDHLRPGRQSAVGAESLP
jgi:RNA polymerase sigma factor (sigma-70 family)